MAKQFYSFHFGNEIGPTIDSLNARRRFLTPRLYEQTLRELESEKIDPFTGVTPAPKTFKIGKCVSRIDEAGLEVQLYWKSDASTEQRSIDVNMQKVDGRWLVDHVGSLF